ncbi:hypothetical protein FBY35_2520 [Streptomyces sp. SLBN-118]|uniref:hypothetical protein n=1 Tax=Streptomyces sp. SLBN-118 TaxID=2768454 RepID=UPI0011670DCE|nr:hypothetical protein [Streptomyces sp. SLBN-118]TQK52094.1 hypothetical protein FBY35_2520 [Streptomyces sp. SLBN-118]
MSRETDSSSSGPQGRGGAAYPSGTPPYGSRQYPSLHPTQDAPDETAAAPAEPPPDEPRTETTLTTRIRINIPGSRPIPPVVMRTPMSEADADAHAAASGGQDNERTGSTRRPEVAQDAAAAAPQAEEKAPASDWFAPRKSSSTSTNGAGLSVPGAQSSASAAPAGPGGASGAPGASANGGGPGAGLPYFSEEQPSGARPPGQAQAGPESAPRPQGSLSDLAANADAPPPAANGFAPGSSTPPPGVRPPSGPTGGPVKGSMPIRPRTGGQGAPAGPGPGVPGQGPGVPGGSGPGGPMMSDDTAVLTPQKPAGPAAEPPGGHVSGDTLTSGIPVVPPEHRSPFGPFGSPGAPPATGPGTGPNPLVPPIIGGPGPQDPDAGFSAPEFPAGTGGSPVGPVVSPPAPAAAGPAPAPRSAPAKKGRSKLVLAGAAVVGLLGIAYGAGLLMNHSEVPKSTTVLGVDIGGGTKEDAVSKLDAALGRRAATPLQLSVGGKKEQLAPDKAGLSLDSQATVRNAAGSDYNPVSVIGSLFGGERVAEPVILVDEEKLSVALSDIAGVSGSATESTIRFEPGRAVAVPGKSGQALDVGRSMISVKDAYRAQVETGRPNLVELPVAGRRPTISQTELDRAMKAFAEPAMSGLITIKAGGKQIQFGPARSLPKILSMKAIDGKLVEVYDKKAIDELLDGVFDGVMITKGDGKKHQVSADDVAQAMGTALRGKTPEERTTVIELNPS